MRNIWDISPPVNEHSPVFPGDTLYSQQMVFSRGANGPVNVSAITLSPHTGAHADAPLHYANGGQAIGDLDLEPYLGPCRVIHCLDCGSLVQPEHLAHALTNAPRRVLLRTARIAHQNWESFTALAPATIALLAINSVALIGIDTPSVDPPESKGLAAHQMLMNHGMRVLENLVLDDVPPGDYELIALPLKLTGADASPVRAILRTL